MRFLFLSASLLLATAMVASPLPAQSPADDSAPGIPAPELQLRVIDSDGTSAPAGSHTKKNITIEVTDANGVPVGGAAVTFRLPDSGPSGKFADGSSASVAYTDASGRAHAGNVSWSSAAGVADIRITAAKGASHTGILFEETLTPGQSAQSKPPKAEVSESESPKQVAQLKMPAPPDSVAASSALPGDPPVAKHSLSAASAAAPLDQRPSVSVTGATQGASGSHSKAKWLIIAAIAIGAGAGVALAAKGKSSSSAGQTTQLTIGSPSVSVGHP
jgi:hypothetical protein